MLFPPFLWIGPFLLLLASAPAVMTPGAGGVSFVVVELDKDETETEGWEVEDESEVFPLESEFLVPFGMLTPSLDRLGLLFILANDNRAERVLFRESRLVGEVALRRHQRALSRAGRGTMLL
jgi:hypothetical protein